MFTGEEEWGAEKEKARRAGGRGLGLPRARTEWKRAGLGTSSRSIFPAAGFPSFLHTDNLRVGLGWRRWGKLAVPLTPLHFPKM